MNKHKVRPSLERCEDRALLTALLAQAPTIAYTHGQIPAPTGFQELRGVLATDHAVYKVGQTVDMRLTLTNRTHHPVELSFSVSLSALSIRDKAGFVWDELGTGRTAADLTEHIQFNPGASMTFTGHWTASSKGDYSVHSEFDPAAAPRFFRVIGDSKGAVGPGHSHHQGNPVGAPGGSATDPGHATPPIIIDKPVRVPTLPKPVMPPIVNPTQPIHNPTQPIHNPTQPIHNPPPVHKPSPPIQARGVRPIVRPTLTHTTTTTGSTTIPNQLA